MTEVGHLVGVKTNKSAETMKDVIKFEAELAKVNMYIWTKLGKKSWLVIQNHLIFLWEQHIRFQNEIIFSDWETTVQYKNY